MDVRLLFLLILQQAVLSLTKSANPNQTLPAPAKPTNQTLHGEHELHTLLVQGYNTDIRPVLQEKASMDVWFDFVLEEVNSVDVKEQIMDVSAFVTLQWFDHNLIWEPENFR